jgi:hypothetical protein
MSEPVARGMSEPVARGFGQLNQAAIHVAGSWILTSSTSEPNNTPAMVPLADMFTLFKALAEITRGGGDLGPAGGPSLPSAAA